LGVVLVRNEHKSTAKLDEFSQCRGNPEQQRAGKKLQKKDLNPDGGTPKKRPLRQLTVTRGERCPPSSKGIATKVQVQQQAENLEDQKRRELTEDCLRKGGRLPRPQTCGKERSHRERLETMRLNPKTLKKYTQIL